MRTIRQPGPVHPVRIESFTGEARYLAFTAPAGASLLAGLTGPLSAAGFQSAVLRFGAASVSPFRYVMPDHAKDDEHVAYFSDPRAPVGLTRIERAAATFGWADGAPFLHCHAVWVEPDGRRRGGHILNGDTMLTEPLAVEAWGFDTIRIETSPDPETNFPLFQPSGESSPGGAVLARVRPNEDILTAIETITRQHGMPNATIHGSVGSLVGTRFTDGRTVGDHATEVLVTAGTVRDGVASLDIVSVDMNGQVQEGRLTRGENAVLITFDLVMVSDRAAR